MPLCYEMPPKTFPKKTTKFYSKKLLIKNTVNLSTSWFYAKTLGKKNVCVLWTKTSTIVTTVK